MKKLIGLFVALSMLSPIFVKAEEEYPDEYESYEQYINDPYYYDEERVKEREQDNIDIQSIAKQIARRSGSSRVLNIPEIRQNEYYFCGPATVAIVLQYKTGKTYNQYTLASEMGTTEKDGTMVYQVKNRLNKELNGVYENYLVSNTDFSSKVVSSLENDYPVICNAKCKMLRGYPNTSRSTHYIVAYGYEAGWIGSTSHDSLFYFDSYDGYTNSYGKHDGSKNEKIYSFKEMKEAIQNATGYYICKK